jgi:Zn-dependent protease with chaperone function
LLAEPIAIPSPTEQAAAYHNVSNLVWGINQFLALLLLPAVFLILGSRTRISTKRRYFKYSILATTLLTLSWLIQLPLDRIRTNNLNQIKNDAGVPIMEWILSQFLQALPSIVLSVLVALFVYWLITKSPKWWLWATGVFSFLILGALVLEPYTIGHAPLGQSPVELKISALAEQIGVPADSIALEDCEPFDSCEIAHVSGLGPTRLVLLNKGLFDAYPESWTLQTFAHESKHYVKDDNLLGWIILTLILLVFFFLLDRICGMIIQRFSKPLGFTSIAQPSALPLMILVLNIMYLIALPPINIFRQHVEFEADRYGLELTHQNQVLAEMVSSWTTKSKYRVSDPSLFFMLFRSSHPSDATRISFANDFESKIKSE